jgi:hypothetical protein
LALQLLLTFWRVGNRPKSQISRTSQARTSLAALLAMCGHQCLDIKKKGTVDESKGVCIGFRCWKLSAFCILELSTLTQTPLLLPTWFASHALVLVVDTTAYVFATFTIVILGILVAVLQSGTKCFHEPSWRCLVSRDPHALSASIFCCQVTWSIKYQIIGMFHACRCCWMS